MTTTTGTTLDRQDVVLLIAAGAEGNYPLDPIRLMKGCFLVSQRGKAAWRSLFDFRPYDYGPFDSDVYRSRDALVSRGMLEVRRQGRYGSYMLTDAGREKVASLRNQIGEQSSDWFAQIGRYVTSRSFNDLLDEVYAAFPDFATRSVYSRS